MNLADLLRQVESIRQHLLVWISYNIDGSNAETHNKTSVWCRLPSPSLLSEMMEGLGVRGQGQTFVEVLSVLMASEVLPLL